MYQRLRLVFTATIFLSAFLLFAVQPMVGKYLLPLLGGTPSVWNTAMVFFQVLLLFGYIYAHFITKLKSVRAQALIHLFLMAAACLSLPISLSSHLDAPTDQPVARQLKTMIGMAAAPFLMLSASAPLLQKWFSRSPHPNADNPYFLYAASNIGSMLALLSYPVAIEPLLALGQQSIAWTVGYAVLIMLFTASALSIRKTKPIAVSDIPTENSSISWKMRLIWIFLAFCPSSLMLGFTTYITTDIASVPLFWVLPLALYLGTFIIAFSNRPVITLDRTRLAFGFSLWALLCLNLGLMHNFVPWITVILHASVFFFTALLCHQELVASKPAAARLTEFYLLISLGGALGGIFNSLVAPVIFKLPLEYYLIMAVSAFALGISGTMKKPIPLPSWSVIIFPGTIIFAAISIMIETPLYLRLIALFVFLSGIMLVDRRRDFIISAFCLSIIALPYSWNKINNSVLTTRNFFGVLRIQDYPNPGVRLMSNGTTNHGAQFLDASKKKIPLTYYYPSGPAGDIFTLLKNSKSQKIAALGLGVGSIACYQKVGRSFDFYEINPEVIALTENPKYFSYLHDCGSQYKIILGDARKKIETAVDNSYDMIFVDVFSSDNIPIHILTREALHIYSRKVKTDGIIVVHISNRFFDLKPEIALLADSAGMTPLTKTGIAVDIPDTKMQSSSSIYTLMTKNPEYVEKFKKAGWEDVNIPHDRKPWSDNYADIIRAMHF